MKQSTQKQQTVVKSNPDAVMMQKRFELENEVIEDQLYHFSEEEVDRLFEQKPWLKEYFFQK